MAFVLKQSDSYVWPVKVELPGDGGKFETSTFDVEFKRLSQTRINDIVAQGQSEALTDRQCCEELVIGWRGVSDGAADIPFSQKALGDLLDIAAVEKAILAAWAESLAGAKRKN